MLFLLLLLMLLLFQLQLLLGNVEGEKTTLEIAHTGCYCPVFPAKELAALQALYNAGGGAFWNYSSTVSVSVSNPTPIYIQNSSWGNAPWDFDQSDPNPCQQGWAFLRFQNCSVIAWEMTNANFSGIISDAVGNLTQLERLVLESETALSGSLPETIGDLSMLNVLVISGTALNGTVPSTIGRLFNLSVLGFYDCSLSGTIPSYIGSLSNLTILDFGSNQFEGTLPNSLWALKSLTVLLLNENKFSGTISLGLGNLTKLLIVDLSNNILSGFIPESAGALSRLILFRVASNLLIGTIPEAITNCSSLAFFLADQNGLSGSVPDSFGRLQNLLSINISYNMLGGVLPDSLAQLRFANTIYLDNNQFDGTLPAFVSQFLQTISLSMNQLTGTISQLLSLCLRLSELYINNNFLTGSIPHELGLLGNLSQLFVANNFFVGSLPHEVIAFPPISGFYANSNLLSGTFPSALVDHPTIVSLLLAQNYFSGSISEWSIDVPLVQIDLSNNKISGTIPASLFSHCKQLSVLALGGNCITGSLPQSICDSNSSKTLTVLTLDGLHASSHCRQNIFPGISTYVMIHSLGTIPSCLFANFPILGTLQLSGNGIQGRLPDNITVSIKNLTLSHNRLTGTIPVSYFDNDWTNFDLSYNHLTGTLPAEVPVTNKTLSYYLHVNRLSGVIPSQLKNTPNIDILSGNLFECDATRKSIPRRDPHSFSYQCGSSSTNTAIYFWISSWGVQLLFVFLCWYLRYRVLWFNEFVARILKFWAVFDEVEVVRYSQSFKKQDGAISMHSSGVNECSDSQLLPKMEVKTQSQQERNQLKYDPYKFRNYVGINNFGKVSKALRRWLVFMSIVLFCMFIPIFTSLSTKYSTYTHSYVWVISNGYMSGVVPSAVLFIVYSWLLVMMYSRFTEKNWLNIIHLINNCPIDCNPRLSLTMKKRIARFSLVTSHIPKYYLMAWYFRMSLFLIYNCALVFTVNTLYVSFTASRSSHFSYFEKEVLALLVSFYKVFYNAFMITMLRWIGPMKFYILPDLDPSTKIIPHTSNMALVRYMLVIGIVNQILIPAISVAIFSENCFYHVFTPARAVITEFEYAIGEVQNRRLFRSGEIISVASYYEFSPPFGYSYQCTTQLMTAFSSVFVYKFFIDGLLLPVSLLLLKQLQLWSYHKFGGQSKVFEYTTMFLNSSLRPMGNRDCDSINATMIFGGDRYTVSLITDTAIILSFGISFPVIAIVGAVSICARSVFLQLCIGRVVCMSYTNNDLVEFVERTSVECGKVGPTLLRAIDLSMWFMSIFMGGVVFDTLGSTEGPVRSLWIFIVMVGGVPFAIRYSNSLYDFCLARKKRNTSTFMQSQDDSDRGVEMGETNVSQQNPLFHGGD